MTIRFPKRHIADDVVERITQAAQRIDKVELQGMQLEQALSQPPGQMASVEGIEDAIVGKALSL